MYNAQKRQGGISLVEVVLAVTVVFFIALLINNLPSSVASINRSRHLSLAKNIAEKRIESLREITYENLSNGTTYFTDPSLSQLPSSVASYSVVDCPPTICTGGEAIRVAKVTIQWKESGEDKSTELTTLIGKEGLAQ